MANSFFEEFVKVAISNDWDYSKFTGMFPMFDKEGMKELYQKLVDEHNDAETE